MVLCNQAKDIRTFIEKFHSNLKVKLSTCYFVMKHFEDSLKRQTAIWKIKRVIEIAGCIYSVYVELSKLTVNTHVTKLTASIMHRRKNLS